MEEETGTCRRECAAYLQDGSAQLCTYTKSNSLGYPFCYSGAYPGSPCRHDLTDEEISKLEKKSQS
jgi:hypothetical protein